MPGALFCCVPGERADGHDFAPEAVARGAVALLCARPLGLGVPEVRVADVRAAMGPVAAAVHGHPSGALAVVGVTGTNGKTTTTWLLQAVLEAAGRPTGLIGTLSGTRTTPEAPDLQARLAELRDEGGGGGGHGGVLPRPRPAPGRRHPVRRGGVHQPRPRPPRLPRPIEDYFAAKARLFAPALADRPWSTSTTPTAGLLRDAADPHRRVLAGRRGRPRARAPVGTAALARPPLVVPLGGALQRAPTPWPPPSAALELGVDEATVVEGLAAAPPVPGRFEAVGLDRRSPSSSTTPTPPARSRPCWAPPAR